MVELIWTVASGRFRNGSDSENDSAARRLTRPRPEKEKSIMPSDSERDTVVAPPTISNPPSAPKGPSGAKAHLPPNPGFVVVFGEQAPRMARFPTYEDALGEAERQRVNLEPLKLYNGRDYATKLRDGASPMLTVPEGKTIEQARKI
jgi:hypothetical protein